MSDREHKLEVLLSEGLDLCVRARKIDNSLLEHEIWNRHPETAAMRYSSKSGTPYLWVQEQYEKDLSDWEKRSRNFLMGRSK